MSDEKQDLEAEFAMFGGIRGVLMRDSAMWWWTTKKTMKKKDVVAADLHKGLLCQVAEGLKKELALQL